MSLLRCEDLSAGYGGCPVLEGLNFSVEAGELVCLVGANGAGKSTLLRTLLRELPPLSGRILLDGRDMAEMSAREIARVSAAVLTDRPHPELMRCRDVVASGRYPYTGLLGKLSPADERIVEESLERIGVEDLAEQDFTRVSDGQRQLVMLARAVCQQPKLLLLDEPTSFLDIRHRLRFYELLREILREGETAAVMSIHELTPIRTYADKVICLKNGRLGRQGTAEEICGGDYLRKLFDLPEQMNTAGLLPD